MSLYRCILMVVVFSACCVAQNPGAEGTSPQQSSSVTQTDAAEITAGQLAYKVMPQYPNQARRNNIDGPVALRAGIGRDGRVMWVEIVSGDMTLAEEAVDAVRNWQFAPYTRNGTPIAVMQRITLDFDHKHKEIRLEPLPPATLISTATRPWLSGAGVYRVGGGVTAPKAIYSPSPAYDDKARKAKYQGVCILALIVGVDGRARDIKVARALGKGLDEKAIEAVRQWKFEPATKDGSPVAVAINVEVNFRLY